MSTSPPPYTYQALRKEWQIRCASFCNNEAQVNEAFEKLVNAYSNTSRHYHNLSHINHMLGLLQKCHSEISEADAVYFSIWYHDAVYNSLNKDNEERSTALAAKELAVLGMSDNTINRISNYILATKAHLPVQDTSLQWLLDFDLSILGAEPEVYKQYTRAVREEYSIYPGFMYKAGRKKAMLHFLEREHIFQTAQFRALYEEQARTNIATEISAL